MKVKSIFIFLALLLPLPGVLHAQNIADLIISEVLAEPDSTGIVDDFGERSGWIEIFNTSLGTVNLGGCFLTDDRSQLTKSLIPKTDSRVQLGPRQVMLFYAAGDGDKGTFYTAFQIRPGSTVYLVSNDGRTVVDSLQVPSDLPKGMSVSKLAKDRKQMKFETAPDPTTPSPRIINGSQNEESNAQKMARQDPHGWILSITSVSVVFGALAILWFLFWLLFERPAKQKAQPKKAAVRKADSIDAETAAAIALALDMEQGGDTYAAIAMALHLYLSDAVHDNESFVITIKRPPVSAWNDKSQNFRQLPR